MAWNVKAGFTYTAKNRREIAQASGVPARQFVDDRNRSRAQAIARWYRTDDRYPLERTGGYWFLDWLRSNYRRHTGEPLEWREPFFEEYCLLFGNPWFESIIVEKPAQIGFTESSIGLVAFCLGAIAVPCGFGFEAERKLRDVVPRIQTTLDFCPPIAQIRKARQSTTGRKDTDFKERKITAGGVECTFWYASTSRSLKGQQRQASSSISSYTAFVQVCDEVELYPAAALPVAKKRQEACTMPSKPFRAGSTPGEEGGIVDAEVKDSGHLFDWFVECPHCKQGQFLDAFGNLLKSVALTLEDGSIDQVFLDPTGKALDWFSHEFPQPVRSLASDEQRKRKIKTAYIGCQHCSSELSSAAISRGYYRCRNTNEVLRELHDRTLLNQQIVSETIAIRMPKLALREFDPPERIRILQSTRNPVDEIQQGFGKPSSIGGGKISLPRLLDCVSRPLPAWITDPEAPQLRVLGADQGLSFNWAIESWWWFPDMEIKTAEDLEIYWASAFKQVVWYGDLQGFHGIEEYATRRSINLIGIDMNPEVQLAGSFAKGHPPNPNVMPEQQVFPFYQTSLKGEGIRRSSRNIQGVEVPCYALHRSFGLDAVRGRIYRNSQSFPPHAGYTPGNELSLLYHYLTSERTKDGLWREQPGSPDHWFHADNFGEMAVLAFLLEPKKRVTVFSAIG